MSIVGELPKFNHEVNDWYVYINKLEQFFIGNGIDDKNANRQRALLLISIHDDTAKLLSDLMYPVKPADASYGELVKKLEAHFKPVISRFAERHKFYEARKLHNETLQQWAARVRSLASNCEFGNFLDIALRDKFIMGMDKCAEKDKLFMEDEKTLSFAKAMEVALTVECARRQYTLDVTVKSDPEVFHTRGNNKKGQLHQSRMVSKKINTAIENAVVCTVCGYKNHTEDSCRFKNYKCSKCHRRGHLKKMCIKNSNNGSGNKSSGSQQCVNYNKKYFCNFIDHDKLSFFHFRAKDNCKPIIVSVTVNGVVLQMEIDSGASISAISNEIYENYFKKYKLLPTTKLLQSYNGTSIQPKGIFNVEIKFNNMSRLVELYVIDNGGPPILGRDWMYAFNINFKQLNHINVSDKQLAKMLNKYADIFDGKLGAFKYHKVTLNLKEDAKPKFFKPRKLPFAIKDKVEKEIEDLINMGVLEPINFSKWGTPIVPILKKDGRVRICGDFKVTLNSQLHIDQYPLPKVEELFAKLHGGKQFSKIDLSMAYQQLVLDENSRDLTTISTTKGLFRYTRLVYGIAAAPAIFQKTIDTLLIGIPGVAVFMDDVLVTAETKKEHLQNLELVLSKLQRAGFKVAESKCEFFQKSVQYLGHIIDEHGLHKDDKKVEAILKLSAPNNINELQSFLGVVNFYRQFVPNMATVAAPLYSLLPNSFEWGSVQEQSFQRIKTILAGKNSLAHYDQSVPCKLIVDASPVGVGAVLVHKYKSGVERPISFASKRCSSAEMKYSQIEREALAIIFGVNKFHQYLFGRKFTLVTDNKPLIAIFGEKKGIPTVAANRLQRYALFLAGYQFNCEYIKSKDNVADYFSRANNSMDDTQLSIPGLIENDVYVNYLSNINTNDKYAISTKFEKIQIETAKDEILKAVVEYIKRGWPTNLKDSKLSPYYKRKNELSEESGAVFWGYRVVVPESVKESILAEIHRTHLGIVKMKSIARAYFWWPGLDKNLEDVARSCNQCLNFGNNPPKHELISWEFPSKPWSRLHLDFFGPLFNKFFLIVIDAHTKWIECIDMNTSITSKRTIDQLRSIFARFGLPDTVVTDNGTSFVSQEFEHFLKLNGVKHLNSPVGHAATNGQAENSVKIVKNALKKSLYNVNVNIHNLSRCLDSFLFDYRTTIHSTTGLSPAQLMFNRNIKTRFDLINPNSNKEIKLNELYNKVSERQNKQKYYYKGKKIKKFNLEDFVMLKDYSVPGKSAWVKGKIVKIIGKSYYLVKNLHKDIICKRHFNQLKFCLNTVKESSCYIPEQIKNQFEKISRANQNSTQKETIENLINDNINEEVVSENSNISQESTNEGRYNLRNKERKNYRV